MTIKFSLCNLLLRFMLKITFIFLLLYAFYRKLRKVKKSFFLTFPFLFTVAPADCLQIFFFTRLWIPFTLLRIGIRFFTLMRIPILFLIKVMQKCDNLSKNPPRLNFLASTALHGSILSL
jgi:hypothetical protein